MVSKDFPVSDFHTVDFAGYGNLYVIQGDEESLRIEAEDNILDMLIVKAENSELSITPKGCFTPTIPINVYVSMKKVRKLRGLGSVKIIGRTDINSSVLTLSTGQYSSLNVSLKTETLMTTLSESSESELRGTAEYNIIIMAGSNVAGPKLKAFGLLTDKIDVRISGSGDAEVYAIEELEVDIIGSGNVLYKGDPELTQSISGSGSIKEA